MDKLYYIRANTTGKVRDRLCIEDVVIPNFNIAQGFGLITLEHIDGEKVLWFKEPVRVPKFNKFYASRIGSVNDPYLLDLVRRLLYLNPKPDTLLIKRITEFIVLRFSRFVSQESEVSMDKEIMVPVLKFEEIEPIVRAGAVSKLIVDDEYVPDNEVPVLFERDSKFSREQKISILSEYRGYLIKDKLESVIHTAAEFLIDKREYIKVTNSKIQGTGLVETSKGVASIKTIAKYIAPRTKSIILEHNETAPFASDISKDKYDYYMGLPEDMSLNEISDVLQVSKGTASLFKKLRIKKAPQL